MIKLKENPSLSKDVLEKLIKKTPFFSIIVSLELEDTANVLVNDLISNVFKFKNIEDAIKENLFKCDIIVNEKLKPFEWILITEEDTFYSKGDNSV